MRTYDIVRFDGGLREAGSLPPADAVARVDRDVRVALRRVKDAMAAADAAGREYTMTDPADAEALAALQDRRDSFAMFAREQSAEIDRYVEGQMAMFASRGLARDRAYREAIVPTGERLPNGTEVFRIVRRGVSLEPAEGSDDDRAASVRASVGYGERIGMSRERTRGRYRDAGLLIEQSAASVDASEVVPFAQACS